MNYFGVEKRVKVVDKVTPRDMDRSKMFTQVPPVIMKKYTVRCQIGGHSNLLHIIKTFLNIGVLGYRYTDLGNFYEINVEATDTQVKQIESILGVIEVEETLKNYKLTMHIDLEHKNKHTLIHDLRDLGINIISYMDYGHSVKIYFKIEATSTQVEILKCLSRFVSIEEIVNE